jgi:hypothetical protein
MSYRRTGAGQIRREGFDSRNSILEKEMKRIPLLAIVLLAFAFPAHAQDAVKQDAMKKDAAVKPADPELKVVLDFLRSL